MVIVFCRKDMLFCRENLLTHLKTLVNAPVTTRRNGKHFVILSPTGQTDKPKAALIRWDNDTVEPFYFVLESGDINVSLSSGKWDITGSPQNSAYLHYINQRNGIMDARIATWQEYLNMSADSSLKRDDEVLMVRQDSLLNDSLQRLTVERINRGDAVGRIIRERYARQLDQEHARMLK